LLANCCSLYWTDSPPAARKMLTPPHAVDSLGASPLSLHFSVSDFPPVPVVLATGAVKTAVERTGWTTANVKARMEAKAKCIVVCVWV
jgi:hypothetical protein